jgi:hypothetical protein
VKRREGNILYNEADITSKIKAISMYNYLDMAF